MLDGIVLEKEKAHNGMLTAVDGAVIARIDFPIEVRRPVDVESGLGLTNAGFP